MEYPKQFSKWTINTVYVVHGVGPLGVVEFLSLKNARLCLKGRGGKMITKREERVTTIIDYTHVQGSLT